MLLQSQAVLEKTFSDNDVVLFQLEARPVVVIDRATWHDLGSPETITVTVEPGDTLNP